MSGVLDCIEYTVHWVMAFVEFFFGKTNTMGLFRECIVIGSKICWIKIRKRKI